MDIQGVKGVLIELCEIPNLSVRHGQAGEFYDECRCNVGSVQMTSEKLFLNICWNLVRRLVVTGEAFQYFVYGTGFGQYVDRTTRNVMRMVQF